jgi:hypothetical protein
MTAMGPIADIRPGALSASYAAKAAGHLASPLIGLVLEYNLARPVVPVREQESWRCR